MESLESRQLLAADGILAIEVSKTTSFIVDSNIETPAGNSPSGAYLSVRVTNTSLTDSLNDVFVQFGDYQRNFVTSPMGASPDGGIDAMTDTITLSPNPATIVNPNAIGTVRHAYQTGDAVIYTSLQDDTSIGLFEGQTYFVHVIDDETISLHTTLADAEVDHHRLPLQPGSGALHAFIKPSAGVYPETTIDVGEARQSGTFALRHEGGVNDATRYLGHLGPGETVVQYWFVSYPLLDAQGVSVAGEKSNQDDDLVLLYDVWATASQGNQPLVAVEDDYSTTMRSEITANANKIEDYSSTMLTPEYRAALEQLLGWSQEEIDEAVSRSIRYHYDLGTINQGFDNDGDGVPDYHAWLQPVGDSTRYDASQFRLIKSFGVMTLRLTGGQETILAFEDQLYFQNMPSNNAGGSGVIYYEFARIGAGSSFISPYNEVASGRDNEKYNGDYGQEIYPIDVDLPKVEFEKDASVTETQEDQIYSYTLVASNPPGQAMEFGHVGDGVYLPPVIHDTVPWGTEYVIGSATTWSPEISQASMLFSFDGGLTWTSDEPDATHDYGTFTTYVGMKPLQLRWWLDDALAPGEQFKVGYDIYVPTGYEAQTQLRYIENVAYLGLGGSEPIHVAEDMVWILPSQMNTASISGTTMVCLQLPGCTLGDGQGSSVEAPLGDMRVELYLDANPNGTLDDWDKLIAAQNTDQDGDYLFSNLKDGTYWVLVAEESIPEGMELFSTSPLRVSLQGIDMIHQDFGFLGQGVIGDRIWFDQDGNGLQDKSESGLSGISVELRSDTNGDGVYGGAGDGPIQNTITSSGGIYHFTQLVPGNYVVRVNGGVSPFGFVQTGDPDGVLDLMTAVALAADDLVIQTADFGFRGTNQLGDQVFLDLDANGIQAAGEQGLANVAVSVTWYGPDGMAGTGDEVTWSTRTDADGNYHVSNLPPGAFRVTVATPPSTVPVSDYDGGHDGTARLHLASSEGNLFLDFGYRGTNGLSGHAYVDNNDDAIFNSGDLPLPNSLVYLDLNDDLYMDPMEPRITTDGAGRYQFTGLLPGDYVLRQIPPRPYVQSSPLGDGAIRVNLSALSAIEKLDFGNQTLPFMTINDFDVDFRVIQGAFDSATFCPGHYSQDIHWSAPGRGENIAQWTFSGLTPGVYRVLLTWSARGDRATNAPFTVIGTAGEPSFTVRINQQIKPSSMQVDNITNGFAFVEIAPEFEVYGDQLMVQLSNDANGYVIADAVQIQRLEMPVARLFSGGQTLWDDQSTFDFGTMYVGSVADRSFTISNISSMPLSLGPTWSLPAGYQLKTPPASYQLAAGQSVSFVLSRDTSIAGDGIGTLSIPIGNRPHDPYDMTLRGLVHESTSVVIDDGDAGFSLAGYWNQANIGYQNDVRYSSAGSRSEANWVFSGLTAGATYQVWATWPEHINRATNVPFTIQGATTTSGLLNQRVTPDDLQLYGKGWERLGTARLGNSTLQVKFSSGSDGFLVADAVRVVMVGQPELQVQVAGTVLPEPGQSVAFGATTVGSPIVKTVTLKNIGTQPVTWGDAITVPGGFVATTPSTTTLSPNESTSFQIRLAATQAGSYSGLVKFMSNTVTKAEFSFLISGTVDVPVANYEQIVDDGDAAYTSNAGWVTYSGIGRGSDVRYAAAGSGSAISSWTFTGLTPFAPVVVSASWAAHPNRASNAPYRVYNDTIAASNLLLERRVDQRLVPDDGYRQGTDWEWLGVVTPTSSRLVVTLANDANAYVLADAIEVRSSGGPEISIEGDNQTFYDGVSTMNFGTTAVGQPMTKTFTIRNLGGTSLNLQSPILPTGYAIVGSMPISIAPGAGTSLTVALTANSAGSFGGWLKVPSNDADENPFDLMLSGTVQNELPQMIDDGATGFTSTGFTNYAGIGYQSDVRYAAAGNGSSSATWSFPVVAGGVYRISTTWVIHSNRATDAPFSVFDGTVTTGKLLGTTRLNQQVNPNDFTSSGVAWEDVGVFAMSGTTLTVRLTNQANQFVIADAVRIERVNPLQVSGLPPGERATSSLTQADLDRVLAQARAIWVDAGLPSALETQLASATARLQELPGQLLGAATSVGLMIDPQAAGWGWYIGSADASSATVVPSESIDLLTVVAHELGHWIGLPDLHDEAYADDIMHAVLDPSVRRLPLAKKPIPLPVSPAPTRPTPLPLSWVEPEKQSIADFWEQACHTDRLNWLHDEVDLAVWS